MLAATSGPGQTATFLLRDDFSGNDAPLFEDREGSAISQGVASPIIHSGPRIVLTDTPPLPPPPPAFPGADREFYRLEQT